MVKESNLAGVTGCAPADFLLPEIMGKRSGLFLAILLILSMAQVKLPVAAAQSTSSDTLDCPSGIISSVDGSCVGEEDNPGQTLASRPIQGAYGGAGVSTSPLLSQYPGLQTQGMNSRIPDFSDLGGLNSSPAQLDALQEAQSLAYQSVPPPTDFQLMVRASLGRLLPVYGDSLFRRECLRPLLLSATRMLPPTTSSDRAINSSFAFGGRSISTLNSPSTAPVRSISRR